MEKPIGVTLHHAEIFEIETAARDAELHYSILEAVEERLWEVAEGEGYCRIEGRVAIFLDNEAPKERLLEALQEGNEARGLGKGCLICFTRKFRTHKYEDPVAIFTDSELDMLREYLPRMRHHDAN